MKFPVIAILELFINSVIPGVLFFSAEKHMGCLKSIYSIHGLSSRFIGLFVSFLGLAAICSIVILIVLNSSF